MNGPVIQTATSFSGSFADDVETASGSTNGTGSFFASLVAPTTSAPSGPSSGGAPSPEVNTLLGFLIVGGTVALLKRRRKGDWAEGTAAA